jgi:hypothetical protein
MSESKAQRVEIRDVDGQTLRRLVDYIYTAEIEVTEDNVQVSRPPISVFQSKAVPSIPVSSIWGFICLLKNWACTGVKGLHSQACALWCGVLFLGRFTIISLVHPGPSSLARQAGIVAGSVFPLIISKGNVRPAKGNPFCVCAEPVCVLCVSVCVCVCECVSE